MYSLSSVIGVAEASPFPLSFRNVDIAYSWDSINQDLWNASQSKITGFTLSIIPAVIVSRGSLCYQDSLH